MYPQLHRDVGRDILDMIYNSDAGISLQNSLSFAGDGLFCEWAWLIDLDSNTFEAYEGFNETPLSDSDRFLFLEYSVNYLCYNNSGKYHPVVKVAEWSLDNLPDKQDFLDTFSSNEE